MAGMTARGARRDTVESVEISESEMQGLSSSVLVARLMNAGVSRLTAERYIEIQQGGAAPSRARPHAVSRR